MVYTIYNILYYILLIIIQSRIKICIMVYTYMHCIILIKKGIRITFISL